MMAEESNATGPAKKHITTACVYCRRRKVKCDGASPSCSNCKLYKQVCEYNFGEDKRKLSQKKHIETLSNRVRLLEDLLKANGIDVPPGESVSHRPDEQFPAGPPPETNRDQSSGQRESLQQPDSRGSQAAFVELAQPAEVSVTESSIRKNDSHQVDVTGDESEQQFPSTAWNPGTSQASMPPPSRPTDRDFAALMSGTGWAGHYMNANSDFLNEFAVIADDDNTSNSPMNMASPVNLHAQPTMRRQSSIDWHDDNSWGNIREARKSQMIELHQSDEMVDQLSARMGAFQIAEDGQLRYFGATSNLHILHNGESSLSRMPTRSVHLEGKLVLQRAGLGYDVSSEFEEHLEKLYFTWEDPAIHVVDEDMYYREKEKYYDGENGTPLFSETLKNAICAIGANLTSRSCPELPESVPEFFSSRAKALLDIELDSPTVATVQALVIMSASEAAFTRDARGWVYSGMAVRISADLGLHLDLSSYVQDGRLTAQELDVRRTTFWGVFVHDNMWSLYVGRPWGINIRDISISRPPQELDRTRNKVWKAYADDISMKTTSGTQQTHYNPVEACADSNISLCAMMRRLSRTLYAGRSVSDDDLKKFASDMRNEFSNWHESLHPDLTVDVSEEDKIYLPHVLQLHMQFYAVSIFLHRPYFSRNSQNQQASIQAQNACAEAAQSMVKLLRLYRKQHTLRRSNVQIVHLLFTASLIHIYTTCSSQGRASEKAMLDLQFCCQALGEIGVAYKNATRALEVIICIKREWQSTANSARLKRSSSVRDDETEQRKRRATTVGDRQGEEMASMLASTAQVLEQVTHGQEQNNLWQFLDQSGSSIGVEGQLGDGFPMLGAFSGNSFAHPLFDTLLPDTYSMGSNMHK